MARIPDDELERLKRSVDLVELVRAAGVELKGTGDTLVGLCPLHEDHEPSLVISRGKNLWSCKGACRRGGSVVDWVMAVEGVGFREAVEMLRGEPVPDEPPRVRPCPLTLGAPDHVVLGEVVEHYHQALKSTPQAQEYLARRGIADATAVDVFKLGFVDRTLGLGLPKRKSAAGVALRDQLERLGVVRSSGHEHLRGCLTVPVHDAAGHVTEIYGRRVDHGAEVPHLYLPGPRDRGVWNLAALRSAKEVILCESLIDALTLWCAGLHNVTAAYGTNGFTESHLEALKAYGIERVLIAFDRDAAGDEGAKAVAERLAGEGISTARVLFPRGMDANEYALKVKPAEHALAVLVRSAVHLAGPLVTRSSASGPAEPPSPPFAAEAAPSAPPAPRPELPAEVREGEVVVRLEDRRYRVRGLEASLSAGHLRVNVLVAREGTECYHVDTLDLYSDRQRQAYVRRAAAELGVRPEKVKADLGKLLLKLEQLQEERIAEALKPKEEAPPMSPEEREAALALLRDPRLVERIGEAFEALGLVGEETSRLVAYLAAVSRKLTRPLAAVVQSSSAAGKSALVSAVLELVPEEERVQYSAMTGQSLFYMAETSLSHKVLAIAEEEGAEKASYALKLLQSEGELSIASTGKDPATGRLVTHSYHVEGPVAILMTTTAVDLDPELQNRCIVLAVDESREQTAAIHRRQRKSRTLEGLASKLRRTQTVELHRRAQRLLKPLFVVNPYAERLSFVDDTTRTRRDHEKYLTLVDTLALLHQHQRPVRTGLVNGERVDYVEATLSDVALANRLAAEALGRTLDELPPQTRRLLGLLEELVEQESSELGVEQCEVRLTRRQIREHTRWGNTQLRVHLFRLVDLEYLLVHGGGRGQTFVYELQYHGEGQDGERFLLGLADPEELGTYDPHLAGLEDDLAGREAEVAGSKRGQNGPMAGGWRGGEEAMATDVSAGIEGFEPDNAHQGVPRNGGSYGPLGRTTAPLLPVAASADDGVV